MSPCFFTQRLSFSPKNVASSEVFVGMRVTSSKCPREENKHPRDKNTTWAVEKITEGEAKFPLRLLVHFNSECHNKKPQKA